MIKFILLFILIFPLYSADALYDAFQNKDYKKAFALLTKASDAGVVEAKYNLALMYYRGDGTKADVSKTAQLLDEAARKGYQKAIDNVGRIYMQIIKFDKAAYWLEKNAASGDTEAYYLLTEIYCEQEKFADAKKWAKKSIESGNLEAKNLWDKYKLEEY